MDNAEIEEIFASLGAVMGGEILLKADAETAPRFLEAGATQWTYEFRRGKTVLMPYWTIRLDAFDDPELLATWVRLAFAAPSRTAAE